MVVFRYIIACSVALCAFVQSVFAQKEALVSIQTPLRQERAVMKKANSLLKSQASPFAHTLDTLDLPFFDDFSVKTTGAPDLRKWINRYVFVNNSYAINPPTMGVATFDILDETGNVYRHAVPTTFAADTLTSQPIRLQPTDADVYFSFAYQPKGYGDMPESMDSLTLQFLSRLNDTTTAWVSVWSVIADANVLRERSPLASPKNVSNDSLSRYFFKVILPVGDTCFLHSGFQFRFINYATRLSDDVLGKEGNCDMWHVDLVYLNKNRNAGDTMMIDVAIQTPITRMLREYTVMPWRHLKNSATAQREQLMSQEAKVTVSPKIANFYNDETAFVAMFILSCIKGNRNSTGAEVRDFGGQSIPPSTTITFDCHLSRDYILNTPQADADSVAFDVQFLLWNYFVSPLLSREYKANDTCAFRQYFYPYYAYDDGTAESGYGVFGNQADRAKVAVKYKAYQRDTLTGIYIYFNSTVDSGNIQPFRLAVWGDKGGVPGNELYSESNCYVQFDSLNSYIHYKLTRPVVIDQGATFYVGWIQQSTAFLNVGFDVSNHIAGKNYVSLNGFTWQPSGIDGQGAIMIRPSFAKQQFGVQTSATPKVAKVHSITVYPNPVRDELHLDLPDMLREKNLRMEIFDLSGKRVLLREVVADSLINVSHLAMGSYFVRFSEGRRVVGYAKFVKR